MPENCKKGWKGAVDSSCVSFSTKSEMGYTKGLSFFSIYILATCFVFPCGANRVQFGFLKFFFPFRTVFGFPLYPLFHLCPVISLSLESVACRHFVSCIAEVIILRLSKNVACLVTFSQMNIFLRQKGHHCLYGLEENI